MKRIFTSIIFVIIALSFTTFAAEKPVQKPDSLVTQKKSDVLKSLQTQFDYHEQQFQSSLTKNQRESQDAMKAIVVQIQMIGIVRSSTDTTITTAVPR